MIQVFMSKRGSGKSKYMISHANQALTQSDGHLVFVDDDARAMHELDRQIRFINAEQFIMDDMCSLYGFVCGILAQDYDVDTLYIDGLLGKIDLNNENSEQNFEKLAQMADDNRINIYFTLNENGEIPAYLEKYQESIEEQL